MFMNCRSISIVFIMLGCITSTYGQHDLRPPGIYEVGDTTIEVYSVKDQNSIREFKIINGTDLIMYREFNRLTKKLKEEGMFKGGYSSGIWKFYGWTGRLKEKINYDDKVKTFYEKKTDVTSVAFDFEKYKADSIFAEKYWRMKKEGQLHTTSKSAHQKEKELQKNETAENKEKVTIPKSSLNSQKESTSKITDETKAEIKTEIAEENVDSLKQKKDTGFFKKLLSAKKSNQSSGYVPPKAALISTEPPASIENTNKEKNVKTASPEKNEPKPTQKENTATIQKRVAEKAEIKKEKIEKQPAVKKKEEPKEQKTNAVVSQKKVIDKQSLSPKKEIKKENDSKKQIVKRQTTNNNAGSNIQKEKGHTNEKKADQVKAKEKHTEEQLKNTNVKESKDTSKIASDSLSVKSRSEKAIVPDSVPLKADQLKSIHK